MKRNYRPKGMLECITTPKPKKINRSDIGIMHKCYCCKMKSEFYIKKNQELITCPYCGASKLRSLLKLEVIKDD